MKHHGQHRARSKQLHPTTSLDMIQSQKSGYYTTYNITRKVFRLTAAFYSHRLYLTILMRWWSIFLHAGHSSGDFAKRWDTICSYKCFHT